MTKLRTMDSKQLIELIKAYDEFESESHHGLRDFSIWYHEKMLSDGPNPVSEGGSPDRNISYLIQRVSRLNKFFGKKALKGTDIKSVDEFALLNTIYHNRGIAKSELYKKAAFETTTGTQILNRLIKKELVKEYLCEQDKRVSRTELTNRGHSVREVAFAAMKKEVKFKVSPLDQEEKANLEKLLKKIDARLTVSFDQEAS